MNDSSSAWHCRRCGAESAPLGFSPWPGETGERIREAICESCWQEWIGVQTKLINEYRLNVLQPEHSAAVREQMEVFLGLREAPEQT